MQKYSFSEFFKNIYFLIITKIFYRGARLIRRPIYIRGKSSMKFSKNLTTGYACRFDLPGKKETTLIIGENCEFGDYVHIVAHEKVVIGSNVLFASKIFISDTNHGDYSGTFEHSNPQTKPNDRKLFTKPVSIGDNVWIGENVCILQGVSIGKGSIIGANSVVNKNIPDYCIAVGSPAVVVKRYNFELMRWVKE